MSNRMAHPWWRSVLPVALAFLLHGCSTGPRCGDGLVEAGETEQTCCQDVGCARGVCDPTRSACVEGWQLVCPADASSGCAPERPWVCDGASPPRYDCAACGCPDGHSCQSGVCLPAATLDRTKDTLGISLDLPLDEYFAFIDEGMTPNAEPYAAVVDRIDALLRADARRNTLLLGESHGSADEQAVAEALLRDLAGRGWGLGRMGIEGGKSPIFDAARVADLGVAPFALYGDLTNDAYCKGVETEAASSLNDAGLYVQYSGSGHTSQEVCYHQQHWSVCTPPHAAECLLSKGRLAVTVILFDPEPWLIGIDQALLWRAGRLLPDAAQFETTLEEYIAVFETHLGANAREPAFDATLAGRALNLRVHPATHASDVFIAYLPRPGRRPFLSRGFRSLFADPTARPFLLAEGIRPQDCSISWDLTPGAERFWFYCDRNGRTLEAQVDGQTSAVSGVTTN